MDTTLLVLIALAGTLTQAGVGFGFGLVFVPFAALLVPTRDAVAMSLLLGTIIAGGIYAEQRTRTSPRAIAPLVIGALLGTPLGVLILVRADETLLRLLVATSVFVSAVVTLATGNGHPHEARPEPLVRQGAVGIMGGVIRGAVSMGGPPIVLYQHWIGGGADRIRGSLTAYFFWVGIPATAMTVPSGVFTSHVIRTALIALPVAAMGVALGRFVRARLSEAWFGRVSMLVLAITAAVAAWGAIDALRG